MRGWTSERVTRVFFLPFQLFPSLAWHNIWEEEEQHPKSSLREEEKSAIENSRHPKNKLFFPLPLLSWWSDSDKPKCKLKSCSWSDFKKIKCCALLSHRRIFCQLSIRRLWIMTSEVIFAKVSRFSLLLSFCLLLLDGVCRVTENRFCFRSLFFESKYQHCWHR